MAARRAWSEVGSFPEKLAKDESEDAALRQGARVDWNSVENGLCELQHLAARAQEKARFQLTKPEALREMSDLVDRIARQLFGLESEGT